MIFDALDQGCPKIEQYGLAPPDISGKANAKVILFFFFFFLLHQHTEHGG